MKILQNKIRGFTLIELLVVSTIIIVLSAIGLVSYANAGRGARDAKRKSDLEAVRQSLVLYRSDTGTYPQFSGAGAYDSMAETLVAADYLSEPVALDPKNEAPHVYTYTSDSIVFSLSTTLETDDSVYTVTNP